MSASGIGAIGGANAAVVLLWIWSWVAVGFLHGPEMPNDVAIILAGWVAGLGHIAEVVIRNKVASYAA